MIGFLFLTISNLNQPKIWEKFFKDVDKSKYKIYNHPKFAGNVTDQLLKSGIISNRVETKWGSSSLVKAEINMMGEAYKDGCDMFIVLSESHIPLYPFDIVYHILESYQYNYLGLMSIYDNIFKTSQWVILNRETVKFILNEKSNSVNSFKKNVKNKNQDVIIDETYFPNLLHNNGIQWFNISTTYVKWLLRGSNDLSLNEYSEGIENIYQSLKMIKKHANKNLETKQFVSRLWRKYNEYQNHPYTFNKISKDDLSDLENSYQLFGRKFSDKSDIEKYIPDLWSRDTYKYLILNILTDLYNSNIDLKIEVSKDTLETFCKNYKGYKNSKKEEIDYNKFMLTKNVGSMLGSDIRVKKVHHSYNQNKDENQLYIYGCNDEVCYNSLSELFYKYKSYNRLMKEMYKLYDKDQKKLNRFTVNLEALHILKWVVDRQILNKDKCNTTDIIIMNGLVEQNHDYKIYKSGKRSVSIGNIFNTKNILHFVKEIGIKFSKIQLNNFQYYMPKVDQMEDQGNLLNLYKLLFVSLLQKKGGYTLTQVHLPNSDLSYKVISTYKQLYKKVMLYKNLSSNIFGATWMLLAVDFKGTDLKIVEKLFKTLAKYEQRNIHHGRFGIKDNIIIDIPIDHKFVDKFKEKNLKYMALSNKLYDLVKDMKRNKEIQYGLMNRYKRNLEIATINYVLSYDEDEEKDDNDK